MKKIFCIALVFIANSLLATGRYPEGIDPIDFRDVAGDLRCPTCTGLSVLESDATFSIQIKEQVAEQMRTGKSKKEIIDFFVDRYGPWILRAPPMQGVNSLAWIVPIAAMLIGPFFIWFFVWRKRQAPTQVQLRSASEIFIEMESALEKMRANS